MAPPRKCEESRRRQRPLGAKHIKQTKVKEVNEGEFDAMRVNVLSIKGSTHPKDSKNNKNMLVLIESAGARGKVIYIP